MKSKHRTENSGILRLSRPASRTQLSDLFSVLGVAVTKVGVKKLQFSDEHLQISDRQITGSQMFNFVRTFPLSGGFLAPNFVLLEGNLPTKRHFSERLEYTPACCHNATAFSDCRTYKPHPAETENAPKAAVIFLQSAENETEFWSTIR